MDSVRTHKKCDSGAKYFVQGGNCNGSVLHYEIFHWFGLCVYREIMDSVRMQGLGTHKNMILE